MGEKKRILTLIESSTSYGREILRGLARYAHERNDWEFTVQPRGMSEPLPSLRSERWDGVIARLSNRRAFESVAALACPTVELLYGDTVPVFGDDDAIAEMAVEFFASRGFERVGFFSFGDCFWVRHRRDSFLTVCRRRGFETESFDAASIRRDARPEPLWNERYEKPLDGWLRGLRLPTAILCANDHQAVWLLNACRRLNLAVPDSVALLGVNNDEHLCELVSPPLSSIDQDAERIGYEAARLLDLKIERRPTADYPKRIPPKKLVLRASTDAFPGDDADFIRAVRYIREFAAGGIRVADVLNELALSDKTLERRFKKRFGHTPERELILTRLRKATELLETTTLPLSTVAELSGFSSERYFAQVFRRENGMSPNRWRNR